MKAAHMAALRENEPRSINENGPAAAWRLAGLLRRFLLRDRFLRLLIIGSHQLLEVGRELPFPGDAEYGASGRDILAHLGAGRSRDFVHHVGLVVNAAQRAFHA